ncbi:hypothetical protein B0H19DRAFT_1067770 [Mycena capillaripes]|nr:hypothetical protein B0H19DRAFT_1067770 [Mycena capillaripes]
MRLGVLSLAAVLISVLAPVHLSSVRQIAQTCSGSICGSTTVPWWRMNTLAPVSDHFFTFTKSLRRASAAEYIQTLNRVDIQTVAEGVAAGIFPNQEGVAVPFFRLYNNAPFNDHIYTTDASEVNVLISEGYSLEDITGYVYNEQICGAVPLFRSYNSVLGDHMFTTSKNEHAAFLKDGYVDQGIAAWVPLAGVISNDDVEAVLRHFAPTEKQEQMSLGEDHPELMKVGNSARHRPCEVSGQTTLQRLSTSVRVQNEFETDSSTGNDKKCLQLLGCS